MKWLNNLIYKIKNLEAIIFEEGSDSEYTFESEMITRTDLEFIDSVS